MTNSLLIYSPVLTPRINYTFSLFFESLISTPYKLTADVSEYKNYSGPKLNYSGQVIEQNEIFIHASGLLSETGVHPQNISVTEWEGLKIFFQTSGGSMPFDVFAASFYLVSRYEEYLPFTGDKHGRYPHTESLAFKNKFLDEPLVNYWAEKLKAILSHRYTDLTFKENTYTFVPTIDVDIAFAHKGRGVFLTIASYLKALSKFDFPLVFKKTMTLLGAREDEYDTFVYMHDIFRVNNVSPIYFVLAGKRGMFDKNIPVSSNAFKELVKELSFRGSMGIHPSYQSANDKLIVKQEIEAVEKRTNGRLTKSRQHFLKMTLPDTYQCLAALKITDDYTMLYPGINGFRASICSPFYFYDLKAEAELSVKVHPGAVMDGTLKDYQKLSPTEAIKINKELIEKVKKSKGEFIPVLHNHALSDKEEWKGWRQVFEQMVKDAV